MKQKKYSESKVKTAQNFLSKYDLTFDSLDEAQKKVLVNYTSVQKQFLLCLIIFTGSLIIWSFIAYAEYQLANSAIDEIGKISIQENEDTLHRYGKLCFRFGFNFGLYSFVALMMLVCIISYSAGLKAKSQILNAFLPALKQSSNNDNTSSN